VVVVRFDKSAIEVVGMTVDVSFAILVVVQDFAVTLIVPMFAFFVLPFFSCVGGVVVDVLFDRL